MVTLPTRKEREENLREYLRPVAPLAVATVLFLRLFTIPEECKVQYYEEWPKGVHPKTGEPVAGQERWSGR